MLNIRNTLREMYGFTICPDVCAFIRRSRAHIVVLWCERTCGTFRTWRLFEGAVSFDDFFVCLFDLVRQRATRT